MSIHVYLSCIHIKASMITPLHQVGGLLVLLLYVCMRHAYTHTHTHTHTHTYHEHTS
jgi:hypothetical protein